MARTLYFSIRISRPTPSGHDHVLNKPGLAVQSQADRVLDAEKKAA